jgi:hypothetical protein
VLAPAERADVIIDFSKYAGQTLILYNDSPAAYPANDPRNDYFTGSPDNRDTGGAAPTAVGYGPNTRTIMQIKIGSKPAPVFDMAKLNAAFASTVTTPGVFAASQNPIIVAQPTYDSAYATSFPSVWPLAGYVNINDTALTFKTVAGTTDTITFKGKGMHDEMGGAYDEYGRMAGKLGLSVPNGNAITQGFIPQGYIDPSSENLIDSMVAMSPVAGDGTQIWKITHNGVDTHPVHFHLFDVQLINRVGWDGAIQLPDANELGWKETVRMNPLQDTIVALRPVAPKLPFGVPQSVRPLDPTQPIGAAMGFTNLDPLTGNPLVPPQLNEVVNFGWEYMWHCHILSHEEMEMMRPMALDVLVSEPATPVVALNGVPGAPMNVVWIDDTPPSDLASWGSPTAEIGYRVERTTVDAGGNDLAPYATVGTALANVTTFRDTTTVAGTAYRYRVFAYNAAGEVGSLPVKVAAAGAYATYTVSPWASAGGTISPSTTETVASGANSSVYTIAPSVHFRIKDVLVNGVSVGTPTSVVLSNVRNDSAIWAVFGPELFPVTVGAVVNGSITPAGPPLVVAAGTGVQAVGHLAAAGLPGTTYMIPYGTHATFNILPDPGFHVVDVLADAVSVGPVLSYTFPDVAAQHTLSATFAADNFTITPSAGANGSIDPATPQDVALGGSATFAITPNAGYRILDVLVDGESVGATSTYTFTDVAGPHDISATFAPRIATTVTINSSATSVRMGRSFVLSGALRPVQPFMTIVIVEVQRPGRSRWSYSSARGVSAVSNWWYRYAPNARGIFRFRARFAGNAAHAPSAVSRTLSVIVW